MTGQPGGRGLDPANRSLPHPSEWPEYTPDVVARVAALIAAGKTFDYRHGPEIAELEEVFAAHHEGRHTLALNSGTSALLAAYFSLGIGPGDEVLVPTLGFLATASPLFLLGAIPVLCDAGDATGNVTAETLVPRITSRTRAIAVTHLFGHPCPMDEITALAAEHGLPVVEDCSHAHGSTYRGRPVGVFGDLAVFSVGGLKMVSGGMGGMLLSRERRPYDLACLLSAFQQRSRLTVGDEGLRRLADIGLGGNLRISPVAALLATSHARRLDELVAAKARNIGALREVLCRRPGISAPPVLPGCTMGGWYDAVVSVDREAAGFTRDDLLAALQAEGVRARVPTTGPLHLTSLFSGAVPAPSERRSMVGTVYGYRPHHLPRSVALHDSWVSLPATYFNDPAGRLVGPYLDAFDRAWQRLDVRRVAQEPRSPSPSLGGPHARR